MASGPTGVVSSQIFEHLQTKIDEDIQVREQIRDILQDLEKQGRTSQSVLARAHSTPPAQLANVVADAEKSLQDQASTVSRLADVASKYPYYKYNGIWTMGIQNTCFYVLLCGWLGGLPLDGSPAQRGRLLTLEQVGAVLGVPVNLKDRDAFHLTVEEYLHALISVIDELTRLAVNSVTLGDYQRPLAISRFVKDVHAGFQILNLKNDALRRRSDSIKYSVKKVEDVVYDLSLRDLIPKEDT